MPISAIAPLRTLEVDVVVVDERVEAAADMNFWFLLFMKKKSSLREISSAGWASPG